MLTSCKKKKADLVVDKMTMLTSKPWKLVSTVFKPSPGASPGPLPFFGITPCQLDNQYIFTSNKLIVDNGTQKCNDTELEQSEINFTVDFNTNTLRGNAGKNDHQPPIHLITRPYNQH